MFTTKSKLLLKWVFLSTSTLFLFSFICRLPSDPLELKNAISSDLIAAKFSTGSDRSYHFVQIDLSNKSTRNLNLIVPAGTIYEPDDANEQTLIQLEDYIVTLKAGEEKSFTVDTYCTESNDRCPDGTFRIGTNSNENMGKLIAYLSKNPGKKNYLQDVVWAISDGHSISNIGNTDEYSSKLRKFTASLTGQKDSWYQSPQQYNVDSDGNINRETVHISGDVAFKADKAMTVHEEIHDAEGNLVIDSGKSFQLRGGNVRYTFAIRVKGWEKGTYYVKVINELNEELVTQEFQV